MFRFLTFLAKQKKCKQNIEIKNVHISNTIKVKNLQMSLDIKSILHIESFLIDYLAQKVVCIFVRMRMIMYENTKQKGAGLSLV